MWSLFFVAVASLALVPCFAKPVKDKHPFCNGLDCPDYVVKKNGSNYELRCYPSYKWTSTVVAGKIHFTQTQGRCMICTLAVTALQSFTNQKKFAWIWYGMVWYGVYDAPPPFPRKPLGPGYSQHTNPELNLGRNRGVDSVRETVSRPSKETSGGF